MFKRFRLFSIILLLTLGLVNPLYAMELVDGVETVVAPVIVGGTITGTTITGGTVTGLATDIAVADGGTGVSTIADGGLVIGNAAGAIEADVAGLTTQILVGGGATTKPVWTTATGTGAPVRAVNPTLLGMTNNGSHLVHRTAVGAANYNPSILTTDYIIAMTDTAAARAVIISTEDEDTGSTDNPRVFVIKDESGGAAANNITVTLESGGTIDGAASYVINQNYQSITLYVDSVNAHIY